MRTALDAPTEALDRHEQDFVAKIREHGWFRTGVLGDDGKPGFSYTTGLWLNTGQPELLMFGMKDPIAHQVFWDIFKDAKSGLALPMATATEAVFGNSMAYVFPVAPSNYPAHLGWSRWFYAGDDFPCSQIVWPDPAGRFPWQDGFDAKFTDDQLDLTVAGWAAAIEARP